jgi:hypothetical protein
VTTTNIDLNDVEEAARLMAGNWEQFDSFILSRGYRLADADRWMIGYTSHRDAGLLAQSNHKPNAGHIVYAGNRIAESLPHFGPRSNPRPQRLALLFSYAGMQECGTSSRL